MAGKRVPKGVERTAPPVKGAAPVARTLPRPAAVAPRQSLPPITPTKASLTNTSQRSLGESREVTKTSPSHSQNPQSRYQPVKVQHVPRTAPPPMRISPAAVRSVSPPISVTHSPAEKVAPLQAPSVASRSVVPPVRTQPPASRSPVQVASTSGVTGRTLVAPMRVSASGTMKREIPQISLTTPMQMDRQKLAPSTTSPSTVQQLREYAKTSGISLPGTRVFPPPRIPESISTVGD